MVSLYTNIMKYNSRTLVTSISALLLFVVGSYLVVARLYSLFDNGSYPLSWPYIVGVLMCVLSVCMWRWLQLQNAMLSWVVALLLGPSVAYIFLLCTGIRMSTSEQPFQIADMLDFLAPITFILLFIWLQPWHSKVKSKKINLRNSNIVTALCIVVGVFVALYGLGQYFLQ